MKIPIETPFAKGELTVSKSPTKYGRHAVLVDLKIPLKRVGKFEDYKKACESAWEFYEALSGGPYPDECDLKWISDLLREHLGICPDEWKEKFPYD